MRVVGIDLGARRIGVAVSDPSGTIASPYEVIVRGATQADDHAAIERVVLEVGAEMVVVGLPITLAGERGPAAEAAQAEADALAERLEVPVELVDERLTTVVADRSLREMAVPGRARRKVVDKVAAAGILQSWLERPR